MTLSDLLSDMPVPTFDAGEHAYTLPGIGPVPSVTRIIRAAGLMQTAGWNDAARDRGTAVHAAIHYAEEGDLDAASLDPAILPYLAGWERFRREAHWTGWGREVRLGHGPGRYAGTADAVGDMGGPTILDLKTGGPAPWHPIQLAGYVACLAHGHSVQRAALYLRDDGSYSLVVRSILEQMRDDEIWRHALALYHYRAAHKLLGETDGK